jgi:hypothetical protein
MQLGLPMVRVRRKIARGCRACSLASITLVLLGVVARPVVAVADPAPVTVTNYTDPGQAQRWGDRSHWKQPWRSYLDTVPATTLLDAIGINFNVGAKLAPSTARLLGDSGFGRARIEVGWNTLEYADPSRLDQTYRRNLVTILTALKENGIRPLILLNANDGDPCPLQPSTLELTQPASAGQTTIHVSPESRDEIVPGRTGISGSIAAQVLFTSVDSGGTVQLSKPLPAPLPAGPLDVVTLRYEPFRPATLANGEPNPGNAATLQGWLEYAGTVTREVKSILGSEEFDVEVWNELSFGSSFLNINAYYEPDIEWEKNGNFGLILQRTVEYLRDPSHGVPNIGIGNGFANESPWWSGSTSPVGLTAIDKHPYAGLRSFPEDAQVNGNRPLDGLGQPAGWLDSEGQYHESFTPTYDAFFPEYFLSGVQTETLAHDLSPQPSFIQGIEHGRYTHPSGGSPPTMWITEANLAPGSGPTPRSQMTAADIRHIESKDILRYLAAYVNKGVTALDFYAVSAGDLSLVDPAFIKAAKASPSSYPGDALGGETMDAVRRLVESMQGAEPISSPRRLALSELTDFSGNVQFEGDGSAAYPPLYNREVFAFLPFQVSERRFAIPVYVMTRNVAQVYRPEAPCSEPTRFDLPAEPYRLAIAGINGRGADVSAYDPLSGESVPVKVVSGSGEEIVIEMPVTDSPRILTIQEQSSEPEPEPAPVPPSPVLEPEAVSGEPEAVPGRERRPAVKSKAPPPNPGGEARTPAKPVGRGMKPTLRIEDGAGLLKKRRMKVFAGCPGPCQLRLSGLLVAGGRSYPMSATPSKTSVSGGPAAVAISLAAAAARRARLALRHEGTVRVAITVRALADGSSATRSRTVVLPRPVGSNLP